MAVPLHFLGVCITFKIIRKHPATYVLLLLILFGEDIVADESLPLIQFSIKPNICILTEGERVCEDELQIKWESNQPRSLCLFRNDKKSPLKCWEEELLGQHQVVISASRNLDFQLREAVNEKLLVTEAFEVVKDNAKFRRRRRNSWNFF